MLPDDPRHGTNNGYNNLGCRCQPCRDAHNARQQRYYREHPEQVERKRSRLRELYRRRHR